MVKASLVVFAVFTVVIAWALARRRAAPAARGPVSRARSAIRLWFDAAALAVFITLALLAAMHWLRLEWFA